MHRAITDFSRDADDDWFARLDCGHNRHVRHRPPFINRPWVVTAAGRRQWLGETLDCLRCDRLEWPAATRRLDRSALHDHHDPRLGDPRPTQTERGLWLQIVVQHGELRLTLAAPERVQVVNAATPGTVPPQTPYWLSAAQTVAFVVETHRAETRCAPATGE